jgi:anthraniloyl-CoA monooxygenase
MDDAATMTALSGLFARHLDGARLESRPDETGRSPWTRFPMITNEHWHAGNVALLGDSAHTAHFSIGSGTKPALQDAAALGRGLASCPPDGLPAALVAYQERRLPVVRALQRDAEASAAWFEHVDRHARLDPLAFGYALRTRKAAPRGEGVRVSALGYGLHRATQWRLGRSARRLGATARRALTEPRRGLPR